MTARTAEKHTASELVYMGERGGVLLFLAHSSSTPNTYIVTYHTGTGETTCDCPAATHGRYTCWHVDHVQAAAEREIIRMDTCTRQCEEICARLTDEQLLRSGQIASERVKLGADFWPAASEADVTFLVCARREWKSRLLRKQREADVAGA